MTNKAYVPTSSYNKEYKPPNNDKYLYFATSEQKIVSQTMAGTGANATIYSVTEGKVFLLTSCAYAGNGGCVIMTPNNQDIISLTATATTNFASFTNSVPFAVYTSKENVRFRCAVGENLTICGYEISDFIYFR